MVLDDEVPGRLWDWLLLQSKERLLEIMLEALALMESSNTRSKTYCICTAAGFEVIGEGKWKFPPK